METGLLIALGFAGVVVVLAIALTRLVRPKTRRGDLNGSEADGQASATWIGIRAAGDDGGFGGRDN